MISRLFALSHLVLIDSLRRYTLLGLFLFALCLEVSGLFFIDFIPKDIGRVSIDFILSIGWFTGFIFLLFHAVQVVAWDEDRRTIHALLARPLSRSEYVLGTYLGLGVLLIFLNVILGLLGYVMITLFKDSYGFSYFSHFSLFHYVISWVGLLSKELILLSVIVLFSALVRGGLPVLILTVAYYLICNGLPIVKQVFSAKEEQAYTILSVILTSLSAFFLDLSRFDFKSIVAQQEKTLSLQMIATEFCVFALFLFLVLWVATTIYEKRDLQ